MSKIGFIGLGKLGLPCALAIENKGHEVVGYDIDFNVATYLESRVIPYQEEGTPELLRNTKIKLESIYDVVEQSEIIFVAVQTPHEKDYEGITPLPKERVDFDYSYLVAAMKNITRACSDLKKETIIVVISTVLPGTIEREIKPLLNKYIKLVYNPFFIAMGTTRRDFENPEFVLLGCDNKKAANKVQKFYKTIHKRPVFKTSIKNAEAIKVLYNTWISTKIAFANTVGMLSHQMGLDADAIIDALSMGTERIISPKYMRAGMGDGGGCHPRDNIALSFVSKREDLPYDWFEGIMKQREEHTKWLADLVEEQARKKDTNQVVLCGLAFKKGTNLTVGSPAILLKHYLQDRGFKVFDWDPHVYPDQERMDLRILDKRLFFITTNHDEFKDLLFNPQSIVLDPWNIVKDQEDVEIIRIGRQNG